MHEKWGAMIALYTCIALNLKMHWCTKYKRKGGAISELLLEYQLELIIIVLNHFWWVDKKREKNGVWTIMNEWLMNYYEWMITA